MCLLSWQVIRFWQISIPISSRNFSPTTRLIRRKPTPDVFRLLSYSWRGRSQRRLAQFSKLVCPKSRRAWDSRCHFSRRLFHHRQLDVGCYRGDELVISAVAGNSYSHPRASASQRKTASTEKSAVVGHVPGAERDHARDRGGRVRLHRRCRLGLGRLSSVFPVVLQRG